jgi:hypothetical protein
VPQALAIHHVLKRVLEGDETFESPLTPKRASAVHAPHNNILAVHKTMTDSLAIQSGHYREHLNRHGHSDPLGFEDAPQHAHDAYYRLFWRLILELGRRLAGDEACQERATSEVCVGVEEEEITALLRVIIDIAEHVAVAPKGPWKQ